MTGQIKLTNGNFALVDDADVAWLSEFTWSEDARGYVKTSVRLAGKKRSVFMHRLITGAKVGEHVDHQNHQTRDNRRGNLRPCTPKQNMRNRVVAKNNRSGLKGVRQGHLSPNWEATIHVDAKQLRLGTFSTPFEAAFAYDRAAVAHFGEFAHLNFRGGRDWLFAFPDKSIQWPPPRVAEAEPWSERRRFER